MVEMSELLFTLSPAPQPLQASSSTHFSDVMLHRQAVICSGVWTNAGSAKGHMEGVSLKRGLLIGILLNHKMTNEILYGLMDLHDCEQL